mmetsp:Transcript_26397/g.26648  ORF Transcript_26397/g.26648 Transcript_26397/m.26648 type:complete len:152 (+) Transcript_26397:274-729(+)
MTEHLTTEELIEFREVFSLVDKDGSGRISKEELGELMDTLGIDASPDDLEQMVMDVDKNGDGTINFDEFVAVMSKKVNAAYTSGEVKSAFKVFEGSAPAGYVRAETLVRNLCTYGSEKLTEDQAYELVMQLEADSNGMINYVDYVNMMMSS